MRPLLFQRSRSVRGVWRACNVWLLGATVAIADPFGCGQDPPPAPTRTVHALSTAQTAAFQDGINGYAGTTDTGLSQNAPAANSGAATTLSADGDEPSGSGKDTTILLRWDLARIPAGSVVQGVSLSVRVVDASTNTYALQALKRGWSEATANWTSAQTGTAWQTAGALGADDRDSATLASITASATGTVQVPWTAAGIAKVQQWVDDPTQNFGVVLGSSSNTNGLDIATSENATVSYRPALSVTYLPPDTGGNAPDASADVASGSGGADTGGASTGGASTGGASTGGASTGGASTGGASTGGASSGGASTGGASGGASSGGAPGTGGEVLESPAATPAVLFAVGDVGDCNTTADTETAKLLDGSTDPIAVLGDIGYPNGSMSDLTNCFGQPWGRHKARVLPAPGNHEYLTSGASAYFEYFGAAAGTPGQGYYSYDLGGWHIIAINSNCTNVSCSAGSAQEQWLRQDLAAHPASCTIAYWHHPRFNSGHHGNSTNMTAIWKALMDYNADVILNGHEHGYQRWKPMNQNGTLVANGITEFVVGTGGTDLAPFTNTKPANVVVRDATSAGILKLTLRPGAYDWQFLPIAGKTFTDQGTGTCH